MLGRRIIRCIRVHVTCLALSLSECLTVAYKAILYLNAQMFNKAWACSQEVRVAESIRMIFISLHSAPSGSSSVYAANMTDQRERLVMRWFSPSTSHSQSYLDFKGLTGALFKVSMSKSNCNLRLLKQLRTVGFNISIFL